MARPETQVDDARDIAADFLRVMGRFDTYRKRFFALGGASCIAPYFLDGDGSPRTDLDITADTITGVVNSLDAVNDLLAQGHRTNLSLATR